MRDRDGEDDRQAAETISPTGKDVVIRLDPDFDARLGPKEKTEMKLIYGSGKQQVSARAYLSSNFFAQPIDAVSSWRYSQAQIPDLVANANPRFRQAAQGLGSALSRACCSCVRHSAANPNRSCASLRRLIGDPRPVPLRTLRRASLAAIALPADSCRKPAPEAAPLSRIRTTPTQPRRTGGSRIL
jgi:hypothetical protein